MSFWSIFGGHSVQPVTIQDVDAAPVPEEWVAEKQRLHDQIRDQIVLTAVSSWELREALAKDVLLELRKR